MLPLAPSRLSPSATLAAASTDGLCTWPCAQHPSPGSPRAFPKRIPRDGPFPAAGITPSLLRTPLRPRAAPSLLPSPSAAPRMVEMKHLCSSPSPVPPTPSSNPTLRFENCHGSRGGSRHHQPYLAPAPVRLPVWLTSNLLALLLPAPSRSCFGFSRTETSSHLAGPRMPPRTSGKQRSGAPAQLGRGGCPLPLPGDASALPSVTDVTCPKSEMGMLLQWGPLHPGAGVMLLASLGVQPERGASPCGPRAAVGQHWPARAEPGNHGRAQEAAAEK